MNIKLKSGRTVYAHNGIFGLCVDKNDGGLLVTHGYDGGVAWPPHEDDEADPGDLTADDMREIADMMIDRWSRFRASLPD
jgi:hypothetical protein